MINVKQNRPLSFAIILMVYALATVVGVTFYQGLRLDWWLSLLIADIVATVIVFIFSVIFNNASVYDPYWSVQPIVIIPLFAVGRELTLLGVLIMVAVGVWGIRLTVNWAYTFGNLNHQDWRYTMLKEKTGAFYPIINFVGIHLVPTLVVYGCILPAVWAVIEGATANALSVVCICISLCAVVLQGTADYQMHKFRKNRNGTFIRNGLWKYSRHPNYLGEILMWWGIALSVLSADITVWYLVFGAIANTLLFFTVSIPLADGRQSQKEGFEEYKSQTRALLPIKK